MDKSPAKIQREKDAWSDYIRIRNHPEKLCRACKKLLPNNREHFSSNSTGRIVAVCHDCVRKKEREPAPLKATQGQCPVCEKLEVLVVDRQAQPPALCCRGCLQLAHRAMAIHDIRTVIGMQRLMEFILKPREIT